MDGWEKSLVTSLKAEELRALHAGPVLVYLLVANADGRMDEQEKEAFLQGLEPPNTLNALFEGVHLAKLMRLIIQARQPYMEQLHRSITVLSEVGTPNGQASYKAFLKNMGQVVAEASGDTGWLAFLKSNVCTEEKQMLAEIDALLNA